MQLQPPMTPRQRFFLAVTVLSFLTVTGVVIGCDSDDGPTVTAPNGGNGGTTPTRNMTAEQQGRDGLEETENGTMIRNKGDVALNVRFNYDEPRHYRLNADTAMPSNPANADSAPTRVASGGSRWMSPPQGMNRCISVVRSPGTRRINGRSILHPHGTVEMRNNCSRSVSVKTACIGESYRSRQFLGKTIYEWEYDNGLSHLGPGEKYPIHFGWRCYRETRGRLYYAACLGTTTTGATPYWTSTEPGYHCLED